MSDRIAVMNLGKVIQIGNPQEIYDRPKTRFVADFIGETNFLPATVQELHSSNEATVLVSGEQPLRVNIGDKTVKSGDAVTIAIRPEKIDLYPASENPPNSLSGTLEEMVFVGTDTRYRVRLSKDVSFVVREQNGLAGRLSAIAVGSPVRAQCSVQFALILTE